MSVEAIKEGVTRVANLAAADASVEFVHVEIAGPKRMLTVRVFIDKPGGVSLEDCTNVSRLMEKVLDDEDFIPSQYVLEVSSPGLERELYSLADFTRFVGNNVKVKLKETVDGSGVIFGEIVSVNGSEISVESKKGMFKFSFENVAKANLRVDLEKEFKKR